MTLYVCDDPVLPSVGVTSGESGQVRAVARLRSGAEDRGDTLTQAGAHIVWVLGTLTQPQHRGSCRLLPTQYQHPPYILCRLQNSLHHQDQEPFRRALS